MKFWAIKAPLTFFLLWLTWDAISSVEDTLNGLFFCFLGGYGIGAITDWIAGIFAENPLESKA